MSITDKVFYSQDSFDRGYLAIVKELNPCVTQ